MNSHRTSIFLVLFFSLWSGLLFFATWHQNLFHLFEDSAVYLLLADYYSPWLDGNAVIYDHIVSSYPLPHLYPMLLGLFGGGAHGIASAYIVTTALWLLAAVLVVCWSFQQSGDRLNSFLVVVLLALLPVTLQFSNQIISEPLLMMLIFLVLLAEKKPDRYPWLVPLLAGFCILARTHAITLAIALITSEWRRRRSPPLLYLALVFVLPVAWWFYLRLSGSADGYLSRHFNWFTGNSFLAWLKFLETSSVNLFLAWSGYFSLTKSLFSQIVAALLLLPVLTAWLQRLRQFRSDAVFVLLFLAILLVWPHPHHQSRLMLPVLPLLMFYLVTGIAVMSTRLRSRAWRQSIQVTAVCLIVVFLSLSSVPLWLRLFTHSQAIGADQARSSLWLSTSREKKALRRIHFVSRLNEAMQELNYLVPPGECIHSLNPAVVSLYSDRVVHEVPDKRVKPGKFNQQLHRCRYVFMLSARTSPDLGSPAFYPLKRLAKYRLVRAFGLQDNRDMRKNPLVSILAELP